MAYPISQYVRNHTVTVAVANWGIAQTHAHSLNDGMRPTAGASTGYTPNIVHVDSAYVTVNGTNYAIDPKVVAVTAVSSTLVTFVVGPATTALRDSLIKLYGAIPTSLTFEMVTRWVHTLEMGATAVADEPLAAPLAAGTLPVALSDLAPGTTLETIFVRTTGLDTNDGRTSTTPFLTIQRACNDVMAMSPLYHSVLIDIGPGSFVGWTLDGVELRNDAKVYICGAVNIVGGAGDKTFTSAGVTTLTSPRDWMATKTLRITPDAAWSVATHSSDLGRKLRIADATHTTWATIAKIQVTGVAAMDYVDINPSLMYTGAVPAWLGAGGNVPAGVVFTIMDNDAATSVTSVTSPARISNIATASTAQYNQNLLGNLRFAGAANLYLTNANRFDLHGCRFESIPYITDCPDCTSQASYVPQFPGSCFPLAVWQRLGYPEAETVNAWGGMGFCTRNAPLECHGSIGTISGMAASGGGASAVNGSDISFIWCSFGGGVTASRSSRVTITYTRLGARVGAEYSSSTKVGPYCTWAAATGALDDTIANSPLNTGLGGLLSIENASYGELVATTTVEGRNDNSSATNVVVSVDGGSTFISTGGHDANLYADNGWLSLTGGSTALMAGNRTFARKNNNVAAPDIYVEESTLKTGATDVWTKLGAVAPAGDAIPSPVISVNRCGTFTLGTPVQGAPTGRLVVGAVGAGTGINCGADGIVRVANSSRCTISDFRINNDDGAAGAIPALVVLHNSFLHYTGENVNSYVARCGTHDNCIQDGSILIGAGVGAGTGYLATEEAAARGIHSDYLAALGTAQGTYIRHE